MSQSTQPILGSSKSPIIKDSYRYFNLVLFVMVALTNSIPAQAFAGIAPAIKDLYDVSALLVNLNSSLFPIFYVVMIFPANYILDTKGLKPGLLFCHTVMISGLMIRCLINTSFYFFLFGTFLCSLGFCFMISANNKFATLWFPQNQIVAANSIALSAILASNCIGYYLSTAFLSKQSDKDQVKRFFIVQSIIIILINLFAIAFFRGIPKYPQNHSSSANRQGYKQSLKKLFTQKNYILIFLSATSILTHFTLFFVGVGWFAEVYDFTSQQCGYIIIFSNIAGFVGGALSGMYHKEKYKLKCQVCLVAALIGFAFLFLGQENSLMWLVYIGVVIIGFFMFPFLTTAMDYASQSAFPIGQATSGGSLSLGGQGFGFLFIIAFSVYINDEVTLQKVRVTHIILIVLIFLSLVFITLSKQKLNRKEYEDRRKQQQKQQQSSLISQE